MKIKQLKEFDSETGEIETEATYTYQTSKRKKGTFCISSPSEILRLIRSMRWQQSFRICYFKY